MKSRSGFFEPNAPNPPHWTVNSCFGVFRSIWMHLGSFLNCMKLIAKQTELVQLMQKLCHEVTSGFFATNGPNPPHLTQN